MKKFPRNLFGARLMAESTCFAQPASPPLTTWRRQCQTPKFHPKPSQNQHDSQIPLPELQVCRQETRPARRDSLGRIQVNRAAVVERPLLVRRKDGLQLLPSPYYHAGRSLELSHQWRAHRTAPPPLPDPFYIVTHI